MKQKTGIVLCYVGAAGVVATAWLGACLDVRWATACLVQGLVFMTLACAGFVIMVSAEH